MSSVVLSGDTSGSVSLTVPAVAGTNTITLPAATGTVMVSGNMPAFSAYLSSNQSISSGVYTKVTCNTKEFDTNTNYDATTNYRFTPTVAGYYQVSGCVDTSGSAATTYQNVVIYKNGSLFKGGNRTTNSGGKVTVSPLIYLNGSTDYLELYTYVIGTSVALSGASTDTYFQASMVRAA